LFGVWLQGDTPTPTSFYYPPHDIFLSRNLFPCATPTNLIPSKVPPFFFEIQLSDTFSVFFQLLGPLWIFSPPLPSPPSYFLPRFRKKPPTPHLSHAAFCIFSALTQQGRGPRGCRCPALPPLFFSPNFPPTDLVFETSLLHLDPVTSSPPFPSSPWGVAFFTHSPSLQAAITCLFFPQVPWSPFPGRFS